MREDGCATGILAVFWTRRFLLGLRLVRAFLGVRSRADTRTATVKSEEDSAREHRAGGGESDPRRACMLTARCSSPVQRSPGPSCMFHLLSTIAVHTLSPH
jgi:hypothetical protein